MTGPWRKEREEAPGTHKPQGRQGHSGANKVDLSLLDSVKNSYMWSEYFCHDGSSLCMHSIIHSDCRRKRDTKGRQTVFFTAFSLMTDFEEEKYHDVTKPRKVQCKTKWKVFQDAVCWINLRNHQDKGLAFWQTRSNATVLHDSMPADCVERLVNTKTEETLYQKVSLFPRTPTT